jgi:hypothetical protein
MRNRSQSGSLLIDKRLNGWSHQSAANKVRWLMGRWHDFDLLFSSILERSFVQIPA